MYSDVKIIIQLKKKHETNILQRCSIQKYSIFPVDEADKINKIKLQKMSFCNATLETSCRYSCDH